MPSLVSLFSRLSHPVLFRPPPPGRLAARPAAAAAFRPFLQPHRGKKCREIGGAHELGGFFNMETAATKMDGFNKVESSAAAERNKEPIAQAVRQHLAGAAKGVLVEVACGYGRACGGYCRHVIERRGFQVRWITWPAEDSATRMTQQR